MKKIVLVSALQIFPPMSGGQLRSANLCRSLTRLGFEVEVYSFTGRKEDYLRGRRTFALQIEKSLRETVNMNPLWGLFQFLCYRFNLPPVWITWLLRFYSPRELRKALQQAELTILDFPFLYPLVKNIQGAVWLNTHNAEYELWSRKPWIAQVVKDIEIKSLASADHVLFCSEQDREKFLGKVLGLDAKSTVVANGVEREAYAPNPTLRANTRSSLGISSDHTVFLFTGSTYSPNQEALAFLQSFCEANRNWMIEQRIIILVVGTVSESVSKGLHFQVLGKVPDMRAYFGAADFGLNPVNQGSGVNVKMMEYIAAELPIVSTEFGCRGIQLEKDRSCLIFERDQLKTTLEKACRLGLQERKALARSALIENEKRVDMSKALEQLVLKQMNRED